MRLPLILLLLLAAMTASSFESDGILDEEQASTSTATTALNGAARLRLRAHRHRHRHRSNQVDELFEMITQDARREKTKRKKNLASSRREKNGPLCATERKARELNSQTEEFDPPFIVEIRCKKLAKYERGETTKLEDQTCVHGLLRCVQRYAEIHVSRRTRGSSHWIPSTVRDVPMGCECMWPVERYGHQEL